MLCRMHFRLGGSSRPTRNVDRHGKWKLRAFASSEVLRKYLESDEPIESVVKQVEACARPADQKKGNGHRHRHQLTPVQLVHVLQSSVPTLLPDMTIDYISLTKRCNALFRALR